MCVQEIKKNPDSSEIQAKYLFKSKLLDAVTLKRKVSETCRPRDSFPRHDKR